VCVDHLKRCKTSKLLLLSRGTWYTIRDHVQRSYLIVWDTEPDQLCVPASIFHCLWRPAKPRTGMSVFSCIRTFLRTSVSTGLNTLCGFRNLIFASFVRWNSCFLQGQRKKSSLLVFLPCHPTLACQTLRDCLCTTDALHNSNSIRYF